MNNMPINAQSIIDQQALNSMVSNSFYKAVEAKYNEFIANESYDDECEECSRRFFFECLIDDNFRNEDSYFELITSDLIQSVKKQWESQCMAYAEYFVNENGWTI